MVYMPIPPDVEAVAHECITAGIEVHRHLGPGFKEIIYERAFCLELHSRGVQYESEKRILVPFKSWMIAGQKVDLIVEGKLLIELKAVPRLRKIHQQQTLSYLKATGLRLGLLMNFNTRLLRDGLKRVVL
jgi:GxxExxY protein